MLYKLLGMAVWRIGRRHLRRRYGSAFGPRRMAIGAGLGLVAAAARMAARRRRRGNGR